MFCVHAGKRCWLQLPVMESRKWQAASKGLPPALNMHENLFFCIWGGLHQLDLKLQLFYKALLIVEDDDAPENKRFFYSILTALIAYLQQQQTFIAEMKTMCRTLSNTCWESMSKALSWFKKHWVKIELYLMGKNHVCTPTPDWWIVMLFIDLVSTATTIS